MRLFVLSMLVELLVRCAASGAPPQAPPVRAPAQAPPSCTCTDCKCDPMLCPQTCPVTPKGYAPAPAGFEWRRDSRGADGWGLFQKAIPTATVAPTHPPSAPVRRILGYRYERQCERDKNGNVIGCRVVAVPVYAE